MRNIFHVCLYIDLCHLKLPIANIDSCFSWTALMDISVVVGHILHWILNICIWLYLYISIYYYWKWTSVHWVDHFLHWIPITEYWILKICIWLYLYINLKECEVLYIWDQKKAWYLWNVSDAWLNATNIFMASTKFWQYNNICCRLKQDLLRHWNFE